SFTYLGLSGEVASETDPNSTSKTYDYTPSGARLSQATTDSTGTSTPGYYSYNAHSDVEALTGASGTTTATYGYTAYGSPVTSMFTGADKNNATSSPASTTTPYSAYRFNAMRWDSTTGQYDMGFRNYDPGLNQFASRDMYDGALADAGLSTDPFTGSRYAFGGGNPISNIELNGHAILVPGSLHALTTQQVQGSGGSSGSSSPNAGCVSSRYSGDCPNAAQAENPANIFGGAITALKDLITAPACMIGAVGGQMVGGMPTGMTQTGQVIFGNSSANLFSGPCSAHIGNSSTVSYNLGYYGAGFLFGSGGDEAEVAGETVEYIGSQGVGQDLKRSATVAGDQWQFNTGHGFDRVHTGPGGVQSDLRTTSLTPDEIEQAIAADAYAHMAAGGSIPRVGSPGFTGPFEGQVQVGGSSVGYRLVQTPDGVYRVPTYWLNP
ncbi:MAG: mucin-2, partial [Actinomycetia bacterium]|nr:mucin-2 [Actinomycetes bacterium]